MDERAKDQAAVGFDHKPTLEKHSSQTGWFEKMNCSDSIGDIYRLFSDAAKGFGGKYGVDQNAQDKSAVGSSQTETGLLFCRVFNFK